MAQDDKERGVRSKALQSLLNGIGRHLSVKQSNGNGFRNLPRPKVFSCCEARDQRMSKPGLSNSSRGEYIAQIRISKPVADNFRTFGNLHRKEFDSIFGDPLEGVEEGRRFARDGVEVSGEGGVIIIHRRFACCEPSRKEVIYRTLLKLNRVASSGWPCFVLGDNATGGATLDKGEQVGPIN